MALEPTPNGTALPGGEPISQWAVPETHAVQRECERERLSGELLAWIGRGPGPIHADLTWNGHHQSSMLVNNKPSAISHPPSIMSSQRRCAFFCLWRRAPFVPLPWKRSRVDGSIGCFTSCCISCTLRTITDNHNQQQQQQQQQYQLHKP